MKLTRQPAPKAVISLTGLVCAADRRRQDRPSARDVVGNDQ
jgi:hypothetical protein